MEGNTAIPRQRRPAVVIARSRSDERRVPRFQNLVVNAWREWEDAPDEDPRWYLEAS
jgi:hypothetical protein